MTNNVTLKDLYEQITNLEDRLDKRYEKRFATLEACVDQNTTFRNQLIGKLSVLMVIIGAGVNYLWDSVFNRN